MSYFFDGSNERLQGTLTTPLDDNAHAITVACFFWIDTTHPAAVDNFVMLGADTGSVEDAMNIATGSTVNTFQFRRDPVVGFESALTATKTGAVDRWVPIIGIQQLDGLSSDVYVDDVTANSTADADLSVLDNISIGESLAATQDFLGYIAEVAVWDIALDSTQRAQYLSGVQASDIAPSNLRCYYPLSTDSGAGPIPNLGLDATGDLTITAANYDASHPSIVPAGGTVAAKARFYQMIRTGTY